MGERGAEERRRSADTAAGQGAHRDRYAAIVAALIDVRLDEATTRFDAEVAGALAENRIEAETARTLRWWQRASVRAAETYAATVMPGVLAVRDDADARARAEADEAAASWRRACDIRASAGRRVEQPVEQPVEHTRYANDTAVPRLVAVPDLATATASRPAAPRQPASEQTRQAIRAAFAPPGPAGATDPELIPSHQVPDMTAMTTRASALIPERKDDRSHANPATTA
jgi:hypothetical protein